MRAVGYQPRYRSTIPLSLSISSCRGPSPPAATCWSRSGPSRSTRSIPRSGSGRSPRPGSGRCWAGTPPDGRGGRARGEPVQAGRRGVLRRRHRPARAPTPSTTSSTSGSSAASRRRSAFAEAAALPLTAITAWETLFDRLDIRRPVPGAANAILIIGGAGGVGSIAIQLARQLTDLTVIATASRPETAAWCRELGAHHVVDHSAAARRRGREARHRPAGLRLLDHQHRRSIWPRS